MHQPPRRPYLFINYRRSVKNEARIIANELSKYFGEDNIFLDTKNITPGSYWEEVLHKELEKAEVLIALVHSKWLHEQDPHSGERRLSLEYDWVREEIRFFLDSEKTIIPILLDNAPWPPLEHLPAPIKDFGRIEYEKVHVDQIDTDITKIVAAIQEIHGSDEPLAITAQTDNDERLLEKTFPLPANYRTPAHLRTIEFPYVGLRYFEAGEAPIYFGRDDEILELMDLIADPDASLLLFYGPSGVGKSSLLNAGLMPRLQDRYHIVGPKRRDYEMGLDRQLDLVRHQLESANRKEQLIVILDQVEEMFTNRNLQFPDEATYFFEHLVRWLRSPEAPYKVILSFRYEQFTKIRNPLEAFGLHYRSFEMGALSRRGVRRAIAGVSTDEQLRRRFQLEIDDDLVDKMTDRLCQDEESHMAPLLQLQLRSMWDLLLEKQYPEKIFDRSLYYDFQKKGLSQMMDFQLAKLPEPWASFLDNGLVLDLLNQLVTDKLTAGEKPVPVLAGRYAHNGDLPVERLLHDLTDTYLVISKPGNIVRLAHDQLAPIVRRAYQDSDKPAQRAWRIIETKSKLDLNDVDFSETDISLIEYGAPYMPTIPDDLAQCMERDRRRYRQERQNRFDLAYNAARENIEHLAYSQALENIQIAAREGLDPEAVRNTALELPFVLYACRQGQLCAEWKDFMAEHKWLPEGATAAFPQPGTPHFHKDLRTWFEIYFPETLEHMQRRHFPTMVSVSGGSFKMGHEGIFKRETPVHKVKLSDYELGETSVTFWQYGFYCLLTGKNIPSDSGFGRGDRPVINVNWFEAVEYCIWLNDYLGYEQVYTKEGLKVTADWSKNGFRLPTEAEWEYAAREGGRDVLFGNGKNVARAEEINFNAAHIYNTRGTSKEIVEMGEHRGRTTPVKTFPPNQLGLYDMSGNVYDWCWDKYLDDDNNPSEYYQQSKGSTDPTGPEGGNEESFRVVKGGSWYANGIACRGAYRLRGRPIDQDNDDGFRVARRPN